MKKRLCPPALYVKLFERLGRRITLIQEAERLIPYAEQILKLISEARNVVSETSIPRGILTIGELTRQMLLARNISSER